MKFTNNWLEALCTCVYFPNIRIRTEYNLSRPLTNDDKVTERAGPPREATRCASPPNQEMQPLLPRKCTASLISISIKVNLLARLGRDAGTWARGRGAWPSPRTPGGARRGGRERTPHPVTPLPLPETPPLPTRPAPAADTEAQTAPVSQRPQPLGERLSPWLLFNARSSGFL